MKYISKALKRYYEEKVISYVLSPRLCYKHFKSKYFKKIDDESKYKVVTTIGMCEKCKKMGQVHYMDPIPTL